LAAIGALALAGCGRKAGLDPPPSAEVAPPAPSQTGASPTTSPQGRPRQAAPNQPFFLDWLLN
jgi:predicted small lipoprotein YifL